MSATGTSTADFITFFGGSINPPGFTTNGAVAGVQAGYNWQFAPSWLVGLETDFQGSNISGQTSANFTNIVTMTVAAKEQVDWFGTVRGRLGYLITPNLLMFGTGGFAYGRVVDTVSVTNISSPTVVFVTSPSFSCFGNAVCAQGRNSHTGTGWTAGGGFEYLVSSTNPLFNLPVTFKAEYLYVDLGEQTLFVPAVSNANAAFATSFGRTNFHVVRVGINLKL